MNEILQNYELKNEGDLSLVDRKIFNPSKVKQLGYAHVFETLRTTPFLDIYCIGLRMNILSVDEEGEDMNLMELLEYFDIEYEPIIRKRLIRVGYSRRKIIDVLMEATRPKSIFLPDIYCQWLEDEGFLKMWNVLEPIVGEIGYLLDFYGIECEEFNGGYPKSEDELIMVEVGDEIQSKDRVLKFEKFNHE